MLTGTERADVLTGGAGADEIYGRGGADSLYGGAGDDLLQGGAGDDALFGGAGFDTASYEDTASGVAVDLAAGRVTFPGERWAAESLESIERAIGGLRDDRLTGDGGANILWGRAGNDTLAGGGGSDALHGEAGDDRIEGGAGADLLYGGAGDDWLDGGGGADAFFGGSGSDTVSYLGTTSGVSVDLGAGVARFPGQAWAGEALTSVENVEGGDFGDRLIGDGGANALFGGAGGDRIFLSAGQDDLRGGAGRDVLVFDFAYDADNLPTLDRAAFHHEVWRMDPDSAFTPDLPGVTIDLAAGTAGFVFGGASGSATISGFEEVVTDAGADVVLGSASGDVIRAGDGENLADGRGGDDVIFGGAASCLGESDLDGAGNPEELRGGAGDDVIFGGGNTVRTNVSDSAYDVELLEDRLFGGSGDDRLVSGLARTEMHGGAGADRFEFTDEIGRKTFWEGYGTEQACRAVASDFDRSEGDTLAFAVRAPDLSAADFRFVGLDTDNDKGLQAAEPGVDVEARKGSYGYYRDSADTVVKVVLWGDEDLHEADVAAYLRLKDFSGVLRESDIRFVWGDEGMA